MIRKCERGDDAAAASMIRLLLEELHLDKPGTVYYDESLNHLSECGHYFVAVEESGELVGGCGISALMEGETNTVELIRFFVAKTAQGRGLGSLLLRKCIQYAKSQNYDKIYLESMDVLKPALHLYEKFGFVHLDQPMGSTGHNACDVWMALDISPEKEQT